jgi:hypothetical protein
MLPFSMPGAMAMLLPAGAVVLHRAGIQQAAVEYGRLYPDTPDRPPIYQAAAEDVAADDEARRDKAEAPAAADRAGVDHAPGEIVRRQLDALEGAGDQARVRQSALHDPAGHAEAGAADILGRNDVAAVEYAAAYMAVPDVDGADVGASVRVLAADERIDDAVVLQPPGDDAVVDAHGRPECGRGADEALAHDRAVDRAAVHGEPQGWQRRVLRSGCADAAARGGRIDRQPIRPGVDHGAALDEDEIHPAADDDRCVAGIRSAARDAGLRKSGGVARDQRGDEQAGEQDPGSERCHRPSPAMPSGDCRRPGPERRSGTSRLRRRSGSPAAGRKPAPLEPQTGR